MQEVKEADNRFQKQGKGSNPTYDIHPTGLHLYARIICIISMFIVENILRTTLIRQFRRACRIHRYVYTRSGFTETQTPTRLQ